MRGAVAEQRHLKFCKVAKKVKLLVNAVREPSDELRVRQRRRWI